MTDDKQLLPSELAFSILRQKVNADQSLDDSVKVALNKDLDSEDMFILKNLKDALEQEPSK